MSALFLVLIILALTCVALGLLFRKRAEERRSMVAFILAIILLVSAVSSLLVEATRIDDDATTVRISIDSYRGDGSADSGTSGDPYFEIRVGWTGEDFSYFGETYASAIFNDTEEIESPFSAMVDIPDGQSWISFTIEVFDWNFEGAIPIDYSPEEEDHTHHYILRPFDYSWTSDGSIDGKDETDCILEYSIIEV
ncbi:MAG: hypothetical protein JSV90_07795 [Methanobacteriota archaeon]|nr:MAG: hypothetical protein JSV90_07795 [Euryarchaeota archaeon]